MLAHHLVKPYDDASRVIRECAEKLGNINVAGFDIEHRNPRMTPAEAQKFARRAHASDRYAT